IGAAANEAARIEGLCKTLDVNVLISEQVQAHLGKGWQSLGKHALRGVGDEIEVFTLENKIC
ncbi:MAG: adenylate/guanylate cyclase domain-containing protein, partial [Rhodospirillaceae bacterium]|nr:adenylate/guanylate cyclase domain-containing protein [Rhodospirillaceae bacterium]